MASSNEVIIFDMINFSAKGSSANFASDIKWILGSCFYFTSILTSTPRLMISGEHELINLLEILEVKFGDNPLPEYDNFEVN